MGQGWSRGGGGVKGGRGGELRKWGGVDRPCSFVEETGVKGGRGGSGGQGWGKDGQGGSRWFEGRAARGRVQGPKRELRLLLPRKEEGEE